MAQRQGHCLLPGDVGFDSRQDKNFNIFFPPGTRRDGRAEPQSLVADPNMPGLNPNPSAVHLLWRDILLIEIRSLEEHFRPGCPLCPFGKSGLMPEPGFSFTLPHLTFITHIVHQNTTNMHLSLTSCHTHNSVMWSAKVMQTENEYTIASIYSKAGPERRRCKG